MRRCWDNRRVAEEGEKHWWALHTRQNRPKERKTPKKKTIRTKPREILQETTGPRKTRAREAIGDLQQQEWRQNTSATEPLFFCVSLFFLVDIMICSSPPRTLVWGPRARAAAGEDTCCVSSWSLSRAQVAGARGRRTRGSVAAVHAGLGDKQPQHNTEAREKEERVCSETAAHASVAGSVSWSIPDGGTKKKLPGPGAAKAKRYIKMRQGMWPV